MWSLKIIRLAKFFYIFEPLRCPRTLDETQVINRIESFIEILKEGKKNKILILSLRFFGVGLYTAAISSIINGIIYHKTEKLRAVLLNSFIILGIFYGATMSFIINLIAIIS